MRADTSVIVLEFDDDRRRPAIPRSADPRRRFHIRPIPLLAIVGIHAAIIAAIALLPGERIPVVETERLVTVVVRPKVVVSQKPSSTQRVIRIPESAPYVSDVPLPEVDPPTVSVLGVGTMPPHPVAGAFDPPSFVRAVGLEPGTGATVVLRIEVLGSGEVGRIEVDVSSGAPDLDRQAVAYTRAAAWSGGMIDGRPATMWIRWGVRLQA